MNDEKILAIYQEVRNRYNFFDYWKTLVETDQSLDVHTKCAKADKALNHDVIVAFAKELALWWDNES
jgi:hypothetical protein